MPHLNASYAPPGESAATLWLERSALNGTFLTCVAYGMLVLLFIQCSHVLLQKEPFRETRRWGLFTYTLAIFVLATLALGSSLKWNELALIDQRNYPGGPAAFYVAFFSYWVTMFSSSCFIVLNWLADALLIYRFYIICNLGYWSLVPPVLMYIGAIVCSIFLLVFTGRSDVGFWSEQAVRVGTAYWSLSVSLNVIITILICCRLLLTRNKVRAVFGGEHGRLYTKVTTMFIESAALYSIWGLVLVVAYARGDNGLRNIFQGPLGQVQGVTTLLIVVRVGQGRAYATKAPTSGANVDTLQFVAQTLTYQTGEEEATVMMDMQSTSEFRKSAGEIPAASTVHDSRTSIHFKTEV